VNRAASVEGREALRLFLALRLPEGTLDRLVEWQSEHLRADVRLVRRDQLHITLAFLGRRPIDDLAPIATALREATGKAKPAVLSAARYRETKSVGMLVLKDEGDHATAFAEDLHQRLERLGVYQREKRQWLPHVTVLRHRKAPRLKPPVPDLGEISPSDAAVYHSVLRPTGAQYDVLDSFALGG
jgi:RNA 2',3'-cyclic 3'-phosphodiesterase